MTVRFDEDHHREIVALIDDTADSIGQQQFRTAWHDWLALSNALQRHTIPAVITTTSSAPAVGLITPTKIDLRLTSEWLEIHAAMIDDADRRLVADLAAASLPVPSAGEEIGRYGIPVDLAWHDRRVVYLHSEDAQDADDLRAEGWTVVTDPDLEAIRRALQTAEEAPS